MSTCTCWHRRARARVGFAEVEREVFGFDHAQLGARLAELWRFPPPICDAILHQHDPAKARIERGLAETLHVADWLVAEMGFGFVPFDHPHGRTSVQPTRSGSPSTTSPSSRTRCARASISGSSSLPDANALSSTA